MYDSIFFTTKNYTTENATFISYETSLVNDSYLLTTIESTITDTNKTTNATTVFESYNSSQTFANTTETVIETTITYFSELTSKKFISSYPQNTSQLTFDITHETSEVSTNTYKYSLNDSFPNSTHPTEYLIQRHQDQTSKNMTSTEKSTISTQLITTFDLTNMNEQTNETSLEFSTLKSSLEPDLNITNISNPNHFISQLDIYGNSNQIDQETDEIIFNGTKNFKSIGKSNESDFKTILKQVNLTVHSSLVAPLPSTIFDLINFSNLHFLILIILISVSFLLLIILLVKVTLIQWNYNSFAPFERQTDDDLDYLSQTNTNDTVITGIRYFTDEESFLIDFNRNELIRAFRMLRMSTNRLRKSIRILNLNRHNEDTIESITYL